MSVEVRAHITGTILRIETAVGAQVEAGDALMTLESMKMEMPLEAPSRGRVREIRVAQGQSVAEDEVLAILD